MRVTHTGGYRFEIEQRGHTVVCDQPRPGGGDTGMTPVELLGGSLGACIGVFAADYLVRNNLPVQGLTVDLEWQGASNPHRIGGYVVKVTVPTSLDERQRASLGRLVKGCTVHNTLHHAPEVSIELIEKT